MSVDDAAVLNPESTKTPLTERLGTIPVKSKPIFIKSLRSLSNNPGNCTMSDS